MIKKIAIVRKVNGKYKLYSRKKNPKTGKRRLLGTFDSLSEVKKREKQIQFFKSHNDDGMADDKETKTLKHLSDLASYLEEAGYIKASDKIFVAMECIDPSLAESDYMMDGISDYERNVGGKEPGAYYSGSAGDMPSLLSVDAPTLVGRIDMHNILKKLAQISEQLDSKGLYAEADVLDSIIKTAVSQSNLIRALKGDNSEKAMRALTEFISSLPYHASPDKELGMTRDEFREFANAIKSGKLDKARELYGVEKDTQNEGIMDLFEGHPELEEKLDNPFTGPDPIEEAYRKYYPGAIK